MELEQVRRRRVLGDELVDADDDARLVLDLALIAVRRVLDLALHEGDRGDRAALIVDAFDVDPRRLLDVAGEPLDGERAAERVDDVGHPGLVGEDLLSPERDPDGALGGECQGFVHRVRVQGLAAAEHGRERLHRDPDDVVLGLLRGEHAAGGLGVEPQRERAPVAGAESLTHDPRPQAARGPELRDLLEEVVVRVEEE